MVNYSNELEKSVLGAILSDAYVFEQIKSEISADVFYVERHRLIYECCLLHEKPDMLLVEQSLKDKKKLDTVGGSNYLIDLIAEASPNAEGYAKILIEKKIIRDAVEGAQTILKKAQDSDAYSLVDDFSRISSTLGSQGTINHSLRPEQILKRDEDKPKAEKLWTGQSMLDNGILNASFQRGHTVLTIADSGHGKTQISLFVAELLLRRGYNIHWFQLEGYDSETAKRFEGFDNVWICDDLYDIEQIKREARRVNREHGTDYIVFDYVQNIECSQNIGKAEKVEYISSQIQKLAKEINCVCNPLSQITIESTRSGWQQEPRYNDVRWSKQLKQDADLIISVFRPSRIDSLVISEEAVKDWTGDAVPYNSVFMKQAKVRHGQQEWRRVHLIHTPQGLKLYSKNEVPF
jgi:replicative DNA helicase